MDNIRVWSEALSTQAIRDSGEFGDDAQSTYLPFLVAEYLFDEGAIDSHDGEHDLSIDPLEYATVVLDDAVYKEISPRAPGSILFDGVDTLVTVPYGADLAPSLEFTFEAWIKPDVGATGGRYVASMGDRGWAVMLMCDGTGAGCCEGGSHVNGSVGLYANVSSSFTCQDVPSSTAAVNGGEWTHVAITLATPHTKMNPRGVSAKVCFVINGVESGCFVDDAFGISPGIAGGEALVIGGASVEGACVDCETEPLKFMGHMSNVHIWREALDPMVIERYMARRLTHAHPYYDALVAAFPFSERTFISTGVDDTKTGAFDAVLTNGTFNATEFVAQDSSSSATMRGPSAFYFNGADQHIVVPFDPVMAPNDRLTIEAWIKPTGEPHQSEPIVVLGDLGWSVYLLCGGDGHLCCGDHVNGSLGFLSKASAHTADVCADAPSSEVPVTYGRWNHIAVTVDVLLKRVQFYIDGELVGETYSWDIALGDGGEQDLGIGDWVDCSGCSPFMGYMDELRIYNAVLSGENIELFMNRSLTGFNHDNRDDVIAYYKFDATFKHGSTLTDLGTNRLDGQIMSSDPEFLAWRSDAAQALEKTLPAPPAPLRCLRFHRAVVRVRCTSTARARLFASIALRISTPPSRRRS